MLSVVHLPYVGLCVLLAWLVRQWLQDRQRHWAAVRANKKGDLYQLRAGEYAHVLDARTAEVLTLLGPLVFPLTSHHQPLHAAPQRCVVIPPNHYVRVRNPVHRSGPERVGTSEKGCAYQLVCTDAARLRCPTSAVALSGTREVRFAQPPFPLFPGEILEHKPRPQTLLAGNEAVLLLCTQDFTEALSTAGDGAASTTARVRRRGEKYYFKGPGLYRPRIEEQSLGVRTAMILASTQAVHLTALEALQEEDPASGMPISRYAGERWTVRFEGAYFPPPNARVDCVADAIALPEGTGARVRATASFVDYYTGQRRREGETWLVTRETAGAAYVPSCHESVLDPCVQQIVLQRHEYCVIANPTPLKQESREGDRAPPQRGHRELRVGPCSFFLESTESSLEGGVKRAWVLTEGEALLVEAALPSGEDGMGVERAVTSRWLVRGPCRYIPPLTVRVLERRRVIALDQNSGVYVRNTNTGAIRCVTGRPFMLSADEELWEKPLSRYTRRLMRAPRLCIRAQEEPDIIADWEESTQHDAEAMLGASLTRHGARRPSSCAVRKRKLDASPACPQSDSEAVNAGEVDPNGVKMQPTNLRRYDVVSVDVEHNTLVRLQDTNSGTSRVVAGPAAVSLEPYEEFTSITLSGGRPKQPNQIHTLSLFLGPDYMSDSIEVETLDHARLKIELAYNWEFDSSAAALTRKKAFTLPDFIGEACEALASRVRVAIASVTFENCHRNSASVIKQAIFSSAADGSAEVRSGDGGDCLYFLANCLRITNVDVQSVEPVDPKTRTALTKSVQLAVEILTKSQENQATHHAARIEQVASGALDLQVVKDKATAERERVTLMEVVVANAAIEQGSASKVQALAESEARLVEVQAELQITPLRCSAHEAAIDAELDILQRRMTADLRHRAILNALLVERAATLAEVEASKYEAIMSALGDGTLVAIAHAGPELKAQLLGALGLQGLLVTDGSSPVNLMNVANQIAAVPANR